MTATPAQLDRAIARAHLAAAERQACLAYEREDTFEARGVWLHAVRALARFDAACVAAGSAA